jgi:uncharacterized peroxidase-related enzyme
VLPLIYDSPTIIQQMLDDYETADIPELHKLCTRWTERFVHESWTATAADIQLLRDAGLNDREIVNWAESASVQTWWVMSADAGGVEIDEFLPEERQVVGRPREVYEHGHWSRDPFSEDANQTVHAAGDSVTWVAVDEQEPEYLRAADWAEKRYGLIPNFFKAFSLRPALFPRHCRALELLERPQSNLLTPALHALVRARVSDLDHCHYFDSSVDELIRQTSDEPELRERLSHYPEGDWSEAERAVLDFATNVNRTSYKVTSQDSDAFRRAGLDDAAYVDVLNTVSIQTSIERVANMFGVVPDKAPLLQLDAPDASRATG